MINRRLFMGSSLAFAALLKGAEPSAQFPTEPRDRLSVSTYPFRALIATYRHNAAPPSNKPLMTLPQFAATIFPEFRVRGIEPWSHHFESIEPDYVRELHQLFERAGVHVVNIPADAPVHLCSQVAGDRESGLNTLKKWVDAAVVLESPGIRVHLPSGADPNDISCATEQLKKLADYGATKNIVINLENDSPKSENPYRILKVLQTVNSPWLRSLPDFCNSMMVEDNPAYNYRALAALFPHAYNISHVKDVEVEAHRTLRVDVRKIIDIAKKAGYRGYFSMEWDGSGDPHDGTRQLIGQCLHALA